jgi:hypothetical protein
MSKGLVIVAYWLVMVLLIVGLDVAFLRNRFALRLLVNIAIVVVFAAGYLIFLRNR